MHKEENSKRQEEMGVLFFQSYSLAILQGKSEEEAYDFAETVVREKYS